MHKWKKKNRRLLRKISKNKEFNFLTIFYVNQLFSTRNHRFNPVVFLQGNFDNFTVLISIIQLAIQP